MKKIISFFVFIILIGQLNSASLVIEGKFQNKNLYVHNGLNKNGVGFCTQEVKVNGQITTDETNSSSYEIDLKALQLKYGENVLIEIIHSDECTPRILNIEDLRPSPSFEIVKMNINNEGLVKWTSINEAGVLPYEIEQYKWNKWVKVGEVMGLGNTQSNEYTFQLTLHSGQNKFRLKQKGLNAQTKISKDFIISSIVNKPSFAIQKKNGSIDFSSETSFEIYDEFGQIVKKGYGKQIEIKKLPKGNYNLCYDSFVADFKK
jgi:hypothetical protein